MDFYVGHGIFFGVIHGIFLLDFFFFWLNFGMNILGHGILLE